jgi:D-alanyl-D-alanine carboxypeptidase
LYGGGGIASNAKEASLFMQSLFSHRIVGDKELLSKMHQRVFPKEKSTYCLGVSNFQFDGFQVYYHGGWWGTDVAYCPEANCSVALFVLERDKRHELASLSIDVLRTMCERKTTSEKKAQSQTKK